MISQTLASVAGQHCLIESIGGQLSVAKFIKKNIIPVELCGGLVARRLVGSIGVSTNHVSSTKAPNQNEMGWVIPCG